ncbi:MAG TPA: DUF3037 domain-containing protein [Ktedonobacteraceae bacterium]
MQDPSSYDYAIIRVVPRVERGEYINVGVILFSRQRAYLGVLTHLEEARLLALASDIDLEVVHAQLQLISLIGAGNVEAGSLARMSPSERFHWLVAPRSTIIQTSPVHSGLCSDPEAILKHLLQTMVLVKS